MDHNKVKQKGVYSQITLLLAHSKNQLESHQSIEMTTLLFFSTKIAKQNHLVIRRYVVMNYFSPAKTSYESKL